MVYQVLRKFAAVLALACTVGAAGAVATAQTFDLGILNTTLVRSNILITGEFDDRFTFKTGSMPGVLGTIVGMDGDGDLIARYRFGVGDFASVAWESWSHPNLVSIPSNPLTDRFAFSQTATGLELDTRYWLQIEGSATEAVYGITLSPIAATVSPVPEPETFVLMLTGLVLIGATVRKRKIRLSLAAVALAASSMANAESFNTLAGSSFIKSFVVTPSADNRLWLTVSGQAAQYSALSFEMLSGGPRVGAVADGELLAATFNDRKNDDFLLTATPYTLQISGTTKANLTVEHGGILILSLGGTVTPVPEPETFAMLLAGLGVIGAFARRRNRPVSPNGL